MTRDYNDLLDEAHHDNLRHLVESGRISYEEPIEPFRPDLDDQSGFLDWLEDSWTGDVIAAVLLCVIVWLAIAGLFVWGS